MGVYFRQHAKTFPRNTQIKASMPLQNQSIEFSNHLPPTNTNFPFERNSTSYHAPQNHPGNRSSQHCLPSGKRKAEKTSGLFEPETKLHIREYMITKDQDDFSSAMQNISSKPIKDNMPEIEHLCRAELPQGEINWTVSSPRTLLSNLPTSISSSILNCSCSLGTIESSHQPLQRQQSSNQLVAQTNCVQACLRDCRHL